MIKRRKEHKKGWVRMSIDATRRHNDIRNSMLGYGYDDAKLSEAEQLLAEVSKWDDLHAEHKGAQKKATAELADARRQLNATYGKHLRIARVALETRSDLWDLLKIEGPRKQSLSEWLSQVKAFYYHYDRAADILSLHNISADIVEQCKAMIEAIEDFKVQQSLSRSFAQEATQKRNTFSGTLDQWMSEFMYVARLALKDNPQYLEALGKTVK